MYRKKEVKKEKISDFSSQNNTKEVYEALKKEYNINSEDLIKFYKIQKFFEKTKNLSPELIKQLEEPGIPLSIFSKELSCLESITKYLKENLNYTNKQIAKLTKRSEKTIWQAYNSSKKFPKFKLEFSKYYLPLSILSNRKFAVLESVVKYLRETLKLSYSEISKLLHRDERTIWTVYSRVKKKNAK